MQSNQKITRKPAPRLKKTPLFILLAMIFIVIAIIATIFISFLNENTKGTPPNYIDALIPSTTNTSSLPESEQSPPASDVAPPDSSTPPQSAEDPNASAQTITVDTIVPETVPVDNEYFKDALFIGDSISKGLKMYGVVPDANVLADQNVGLDQIYNNKPVYLTSPSAKEKSTLWDAINIKMPNPKKIYVLLGSNGIPGYSNEKQMEYYGDLLDKLIKKFPEAIIYVQSVTPITKTSEYIRKTFNTEKINDFNTKLLPLAKEKGVFYLELDKMLKDKDGFLKAEYAASDGMHMEKAGHQAIYKYYKTHTVQKDGTASVIPKP